MNPPYYDIVVIDVETTTMFTPEINQLPHAERICFHELACIGTIGIPVERSPIVADIKDGSLASIEHACKKLLSTTIIAGFNIIDFDLPLIQDTIARKNAIRTHNPFLPELPNAHIFDPFYEIRRETGRWYSLQSLLEANGLPRKTADGSQAAMWLASGDPYDAAMAYAYCLNDCAIELRLCQKAIRHGLYLPARPSRDEIDDLFWQPDMDNLPMMQRWIKKAGE